MTAPLSLVSYSILASLILVAPPALAVSVDRPPRESIVSMGETIAITDVRVRSTESGVSITAIADRPLAASETRVSGNATIVTIPDAALDLADAAAAEQFAPAEGIALVQVSAIAGGGVQIAITGTDAPPTIDTTESDSGLVLLATLGTADASADDADALQLVVTATRTAEEVLDVPRSIAVIDREQIQDQLSFTNSLADILGRLVPGLSPPSFNNSTSQLELRGRPIVVLIDGVPQTPNSNSNAADLRVIDPALIERIEILRGPSAVFGDGGTGGVVNIITQAPAEDGSQFELTAGIGTSLTSSDGDSHFYSGSLSSSGTDGPVDALFSLSFDASNSRYDAEGDRIIPTTTSDTDRFGLLAKLGYDFDEEQRLELSYSFYRDSLDTEFLPDESVTFISGLQKGRTIRIGDIDYEDEPHQTNHVLNLTYRHRDILNSQLDFQAYFRDRELVQRLTDLRPSLLNGSPLFEPFPDVWQTGLDSTEWGGRLQMDTPLDEYVNLVWGVDYTNEENDQPVRVADNDDFDNNREFNIVDDSLTQGGPYDVESLGLFAQGSWEITEQLEISGGLRYENINVEVEDYRLAFVTTANLPRDRDGGSNSFDDVAFNAGLVYRPAPEVGLFASFAQGFSIPDVSSVLNSEPGFDISSDLQLEPQKVDNYEIGVRLEFDRVQASLSGFYNESDLGIRLSLDPDGRAQLLRAPQRNYGVEATIDWQPDDAWRLGGLFSWNEGDDDFDNDGDYQAASILDVKPFKLGLYVENDTTPTWTNRLELLAVGDRDRSFDEGVDITPIDGYITLDFLSRLQLGDGQLTLGISNLLNEQYLPTSSQVLNTLPVESRRAAAPGRTISLRYQLQF